VVRGELMRTPADAKPPRLLFRAFLASGETSAEITRAQMGLFAQVPTTDVRR